MPALSMQSIGLYASYIALVRILILHSVCSLVTDPAQNNYHPGDQIRANGNTFRVLDVYNEHGTLSILLGYG